MNDRSWLSSSGGVGRPDSRLISRLDGRARNCALAGAGEKSLALLVAVGRLADQAADRLLGGSVFRAERRSASRALRPIRRCGWSVRRSHGPQRHCRPSWTSAEASKHGVHRCEQTLGLAASWLQVSVPKRFNLLGVQGVSRRLQTTDQATRRKCGVYADKDLFMLRSPWPPRRVAERRKLAESCR